MKGVKTHLIPHPEHNHQTGSYANGKTNNVDSGIHLVVPDEPESKDEVFFKHSFAGIIQCQFITKIIIMCFHNKISAIICKIKNINLLDFYGEQVTLPECTGSEQPVVRLRT